MQPQAELRGGHVRIRGRCHDERGDADRLRVDPQRELGHGRVPRERDLVDLAGVDASELADLVGELLQRRAGEPAQAFQRVRVEHRRGDARDHVGAERLLLVEHRPHRDRRPRADVEECGDDRGGTEVECDPVELLARVTRLDVDQEVVDDHTGDAEGRFAEHLGQSSQHTGLDPQLEVIDGVE